MITVFYDSQCSVCRREINYYRRIAPIHTFHWHAITPKDTVLSALGISSLEALKILHVQDQQGQLQRGVAGFITIWRQLPYFWLLAKIVSWPPIFLLAQWAYRHFAAYRFARLAHCQLARQDASDSTEAATKTDDRLK